MKTLAERVEYGLALREMSQSELARRAGVTRGTISNVITGKAQSFTAEVAMKVAKVLEVNPFWLVLGEGKPTKDTIHPDIKRELEHLFGQIPEENQKLAISVIRQFSKN